MSTPISRADAAKKRNEGGEWYKTNDMASNTSNFSSPSKAKVSNISCLTGEKGANSTPSRASRDEESDFTKLCREGGHKGLLQIQENTRSDKPVQYKRNGGDWYYTEDKSTKSSSKKGNTSYEEELAKAHIKASETKESEYIKLAKAGGDPDLLKIAENKPVSGKGFATPKSNPIWCGGDGAEAKTTPGGKRVAPKMQTEAPFASHY